jgi:hypothetical protein
MKRKFINSDRQQFYLIHKNILLHLLDNSKLFIIQNNYTLLS